MSETSSPSARPAEEISRGVAALAEHLQRSGIAFLPASRPAEAKRIAETWIAKAEMDDLVESPSGSTGASTAVSTAPVKPAAEIANSPVSSKPATRLDPVASFSAAQGAYDGVQLSADDRQSKLHEMSLTVAECSKCEVLATCRSQTVFGEGSVSPRFVFMGEAPGADEDQSGRPFVGRAGQLLTKMISACTLDRDECYILNSIKCRPPGNRNPEQDELQNCRDFYQQQLAILRPEYIVCLGAIAAKELLSSKLSVGRLRGKLHQYHTSKVLVTYHPAYLLRNPDAKKLAWQDLQYLMADAGINVG